MPPGQIGPELPAVPSSEERKNPTHNLPTPTNRPTIEEEYRRWRGCTGLRNPPQICNPGCNPWRAMDEPQTEGSGGRLPPTRTAVAAPSPENEDLLAYVDQLTVAELRELLTKIRKRIRDKRRA